MKFGISPFTRAFSYPNGKAGFAVQIYHMLEILGPC